MAYEGKRCSHFRPIDLRCPDCEKDMQLRSGVLAHKDRAIVHNPGGNGFRISTIWAFLAVHGDGDEGVVGASMPNGWMVPLVAADRVRVPQLRDIAIASGKASSLSIVLAKFDHRTDEEVVT